MDNVNWEIKSIIFKLYFTRDVCLTPAVTAETGTDVFVGRKCLNSTRQMGKLAEEHDMPYIVLHSYRPAKAKKHRKWKGDLENKMAYTCKPETTTTKWELCLEENLRILELSQ